MRARKTRARRTTCSGLRSASGGISLCAPSAGGCDGVPMARLRPRCRRGRPETRDDGERRALTEIEGRSFGMKEMVYLQRKEVAAEKAEISGDLVSLDFYGTTVSQFFVHLTTSIVEGCEPIGVLIYANVAAHVLTEKLIHQITQHTSYFWWPAIPSLHCRQTRSASGRSQTGLFERRSSSKPTM
jgi:hypothetical protein